MTQGTNTREQRQAKTCQDIVKSPTAHPEGHNSGNDKHRGAKEAYTTHEDCKAPTINKRRPPEKDLTSDLHHGTALPGVQPPPATTTTAGACRGGGRAVQYHSDSEYRSLGKKKQAVYRQSIKNRQQRICSTKHCECLAKDQLQGTCDIQAKAAPATPGLLNENYLKSPQQHLC